MNTKLFKMNELKIREEDLKMIGQILQTGGLVAFPTETVYGLGANALNPEAAKKIYAAKGRPSDNPLIIHISEINAIERIIEDFPEKARKIAAEFWPGPLTMVLRKSEQVPMETTGGLTTVAIRMPENSIAKEIIKSGGGYIAAPSANSSGKPSPTCAEHVQEDLSGKIDAIVDGGEVRLGVESTILDMTQNQPVILRPGMITKEMIENVIGEVEVATAREDDRPKAPGMKYRHYAPKGEMVIVKGIKEEEVQAIQKLTLEKVEQGRTVGILASEENADCYSNGIVKVAGSVQKQEEVAKNLYALLRMFDKENVEFIFSESFSYEGVGTAIMNRLEKAAGHHIVKAEDIIKINKNEEE